MIHVFKSGGEWTTPDGRNYTIKAIEQNEKPAYIKKGWKSSLEEIKKPRTPKVTVKVD